VLVGRAGSIEPNLGEMASGYDGARGDPAGRVDLPA
jgi:hypothetical protein